MKKRSASLRLIGSRTAANRLILALGLGFAVSTGSWAEEGQATEDQAAASTFKFDSQGELALESRMFRTDNDPRTKDVNLGLSTRLTLSLEKDSFQSRARAIARLDELDSTRNRFFAEELWAGYNFTAGKARAGFQTFSWGVNDLMTPADQINSRNYDTDIEKPEKIGELAAGLDLDTGYGNVGIYLMPYYQAPNYSSSVGRLNIFPLPLSEASWMERREGAASQNRFGPQWALRYLENVVGLDLSLFMIQHQDRTKPILKMSASGTALEPIFLNTRDVGGTALYATGGWIFRIEAVNRDFDSSVQVAGADMSMIPDHTVIAPGVEYGWSFSNGWESGVLLEHQRILGPSQGVRQKLSLFQNDIAMSYRLVFNNEMGGELRGTAVADLERSPELLYALSYSQRLSDVWKLGAGVRWLDAHQDSASPVGLEAIGKSGQVTFSLTRFF